MLLRRVILHVKSENWFAVALDFIIVVLGIFVGMQATEWQDSLKAKRQVNDVIQTAILEGRNNIISLDDTVDIILSNSEVFSENLSALIQCNNSSENIDNFNEALFLSGDSFIVSINIIAFNKLLIPDYIDMFSKEFSNTIRDYKSGVIEIMRQAEENNRVYFDKFNHINNYRVVELGDKNDAFNRRFEVTASFDQICNDQEQINALYMGYSLRAANADLYSTLSLATQQVVDFISAQTRAK